MENAYAKKTFFSFFHRSFMKKKHKEKKQKVQTKSYILSFSTIFSRGQDENQKNSTRG